jgi:hypothetical protein
MLGWIFVFSLMAITATLAEVTGTISAGSGLIASALFSFLLILSALARIMRGRA